MNYKRKVFLLVIAIIVVYFGCKFFNTNKVSSKPTNLAVNTPTTTQEKWVKFSSDFLKLSLNYPEDWKVSEHSSGYYIELEAKIPDTDKGDMFYSIFITRQENTNKESFEDFVFPKDPYGDTDKSKLYSKSTTNSLTVYRTDNLISQPGSLHYFVTKDGSVYINIHFFPDYPDHPDHPVVNQEKLLMYTNKIIDSLSIN